MRVDLAFSVELEPAEAEALRLAAAGMPDAGIAWRLKLSLGELQRLFGGMFLENGLPVNLATWAHRDELKVELREGSVKAKKV